MNGGTAEEVNKNIDYAYSWKKEKNWDYSIAITDLPIYKNKKMKVFGLTASPNYIMNIRSERVKVLGLSGPTNYNSMERIKEELAHAEEVFHKLNANVINTEYKSIEESAFYIEKFLIDESI